MASVARSWPPRARIRPAIALAGLAAIAKIAVEAGLGAPLLPTTTWAAVPGAHAAGFAAGLLLGLGRHAWAPIANRGIIPGFHAFPRLRGIARGGGEG